MKKSHYKNVSTIFLDVLNKMCRNSHTDFRLLGIYLSLFEILPKETLEIVIAEAYSKRKTRSWFAEFHKSMRNSDFYSQCYRIDPNPTLEGEELEEYRQLESELSDVYKKMDKLDVELRKTVPDESDPTYIQKQAEYSLTYKTWFKHFYPQEKSRRRLELRTKLRREEKVSINGNLDSILYTTIHTDEKNILYNAMKIAFEEFLKHKKIRTGKSKHILR